MKLSVNKSYMLGFGFPIGVQKKESTIKAVENEFLGESRFRSHAFRKGHVQLFILNIIAILAVGFLEKDSISNYLLIALTITLLVTSTLVRYSVSQLPDLPSDFLDERERHLRDETLTVSYKWLTFITAGFMIASAFNNQPISSQNTLVSLIAFSAIALTLPSLIMAWKCKSI